MPTQGDKLQPRGGFKPPEFSWWGAGTLIVLAVLVVVMVLVGPC